MGGGGKEDGIKRATCHLFISETRDLHPFVRRLTIRNDTTATDFVVEARSPVETFPAVSAHPPDPLPPSPSAAPFTRHQL